MNYISNKYRTGQDIDLAIFHENREQLDQINNDFIEILNNISRTARYPISTITVTGINSDITNSGITYSVDPDNKERSFNLNLGFEIPTETIRSNWDEDKDYVLDKNGIWKEKRAITNYLKLINNQLRINYDSTDEELPTYNYSPFIIGEFEEVSGDNTSVVNNNTILAVGTGANNTNRNTALLVNKIGETYIKDLYVNSLTTNDIDISGTSTINNANISNLTITDTINLPKIIFSSSTCPLINVSREDITYSSGSLHIHIKNINEEILEEENLDGISFSFFCPTNTNLTSRVIITLHSDDTTTYVSNFRNINLKDSKGNFITFSKINGRMVTVRYYEGNFFLCNEGGDAFLDENENSIDNISSVKLKGDYIINSSLPYNVFSCSCCADDNYVYILGDDASTSSNLTNFYKFDGTTWTKVSNLNNRAMNSCAVVYNGDIHLLGEHNYPTTFVKFNGTEWEDLDPIPKNFDKSGTAIVFNDCIHILGGTYDRKMHYKWNGATWIEVERLPFDLANCQAVVYNNSIHIVQGNKHYKWNDNWWSEVSSCPNIGDNFVLGVINNRIHAFGGSVNQKSHYSYNGSTWIQETNLPYNWRGRGCYNKNGIYMIGNVSNSIDFLKQSILSYKLIANEIEYNI